jgi:sugar lactone lactonase YvrE
VVARFPHRPGGIGWLPDGRMLVVEMHERKIYRLDPGGMAVHSNLSGQIPHMLNDMVVDSRGYAYVGNVGFDYLGGESPRPTFLTMVDPQGGFHRVAEDMHSANGMAILQDGRTLVVAETSACRLTAFDIGQDGTLGNRRVWAELGKGMPDGIAADADDCIWAAMFFGKAVWRVKQDGEIIDKAVPATEAYACALGGPERRTLFVATSTTHDPDKCRALRSGRIEMMKVGVSGAGSP